MPKFADGQLVVVTRGDRLWVDIDCSGNAQVYNALMLWIVPPERTT